MQIWRITQSSPGDELHEGEASEASAFCFDNASPEKSCFVDGLVCFLSLCLRVFEFLNAARREWNLPKERESFFSVSPFASEGKTDEVEEFTIAERTVKVCLLHFRLEYLRKFVPDRIYFQAGVIWLNAFTGFNDGGNWSSFAWWFYRSIFFVRFSLSKMLEEVKQLLLLRQRMSLKSSFSLPWGRYWACNRVGTPPDIT